MGPRRAGRGLLREGDYERALADLNLAIQIDPKNGGWYSSRAWIQETLGRTKEAIADYRQAMALEPGRADSREALERLGETVAP